MKAKLYFGSICKDKEEQKEVRSPYDGRVVSRFSVSNEDDAREILHIARKASSQTKIGSYASACQLAFGCRTKIRINA